MVVPSSENVYCEVKAKLCKVPMSGAHWGNVHSNREESAVVSLTEKKKCGKILLLDYVNIWRPVSDDVIMPPSEIK